MGTTYYVSAANGNNNNPGNDPGKPMRTIQAAINKAIAGDTVSVLAGSYTERLHIQKPATAAEPLLIAAHEGEEVILDGSGLLIPEDAALIVVQQSQDVILDGLTIRQSGGCGMMLSKSSRITISGCKVESSFAGGILADQCDKLLIEKCRIHGCARRFLAYGSSGSNVALSVRHSTDVTIQENQIFENSDEGIAVAVGCEKVTVRKNTCYDNRNGQIGITSAVDVLIDSNLCYHTGNSQLLDLQGNRGPGITKNDLSKYRTGGVWHTRNVRVVNNIVVGCGVGFRTSRYGGQLTRFQLAHNTILNSTLNSVEINLQGTSILSYIENNLIASSNSREIARVSKGEGIVWRHNLWSDFPGSNIYNPVSDIVETDIGVAEINAPVVAGRVIPDTYKLIDGSIAINRGVVRKDQAVVDFWGNQRDGMPDLGANEFPSTNVGEPVETIPLPNAGTRVSVGLIVLYNFKEGQGREVKDVSGVGQALNLRIMNESAVKWTENGLQVNKPVRITSERPAQKVYDACRAKNEITVEAWVTPANNTQDGPARIISISKNKVERNITVGQGLWGTEAPDRFIVRLRTTQTSANGLPAVVSPPGTASKSLTHVAYTRTGDGQATLYINGQDRGLLKVAGDFNNWDAGMALILGNELSDDRPWLGEFKLVALYSRALSSAEVIHNYEAGYLTPNQVSADFSIQSGSERGVAPHLVEFDSSASSATAGIAGYYWEFGNGQTSNQANPTHTYTAAGIYTVSLTVTDKQGNTAKITKVNLITVVSTPLPPLPSHYARFILIDVDTSTVQAFGIQYPNMRCAVLWNEEPSHMLVFADADDVERSFAGGGNIELIWVDPLEIV